MKNKKIENIVLFFLGAGCFFISQPLLRIPILNVLNQNFKYNQLAFLYPLFINGMVIFTSGLFEEGFRFLFRNFLLRDENTEKKGLISFSNRFSNAIFFGLGHGLCEVGFLATMIVGHTVTRVNLIFIIAERTIAVVFHICLTVIVFKGFILNKKYLYTIIAIFLHSGFNSLIMFSQSLGVINLYIIWAIFDIILLVYVLKSKKVFKEWNLWKKLV